MALIKCDACDAIHESTLPVCPVCGRCPCCGTRRVSKRELAEHSACPTCGAPYCSGCGRCHHCGALRFADMEAHSCGFPVDPEKVRSVEESFGLNRKGSWGCLFALAFVLGGLAVGMLLRSA
jgi:hypothetical protein